MNLLDCVNIAKQKLFRNKKTKYTIILMIFCNFLLLFSVLFSINFSNLINNSLSKNIGFREFFVPVKTDEEDLGYSKLQNIDHVVFVYDSKYDNYTAQSDYKDEKNDGYIDLLYYNEKIIPNILSGRKIVTGEKGVAICPNKFYPSSEAANLFMNNEKIVDGKKLIGTKFKINYNSYKIENDEMVIDKDFTKEFEIVGTYDSDEIMYPLNSCFISIEDMKDMKDINVENEEGSYYNFLVVVDNIKNNLKVQNKILELGFLNASIRAYLDTNVVNFINYSSIAVIAIIMIAIIILIISYIKKNIINSQNYIGILKTSGFNNFNIILICFIEQFLLLLISYLISVIMFFISLFIIDKLVISKYISTIFNLVISPIIFFEIFLFILIFTIIINVYFINKFNKNSITKMIRSES